MSSAKPVLGLLVLISVLVVSSIVHLDTSVGGLRTALSGIATTLDNEPQVVVIRKPENMKTGKLSKIINGTTVTLDYEWDCTVEGWRAILEDWKIICDNS